MIRNQDWDEIDYDKCHMNVVILFLLCLPLTHLAYTMDGSVKRNDTTVLYINPVHTNFKCNHCNLNFFQKNFKTISK